MNILLQLGIICVVCIAGDLISLLLPFAFPSSVISMLLLFFLLLFRFLKTSRIQTVAEFFQKNMAFFFIPSSVGIMQNFALLKSIWVQFVLVCVLSTIITFAVTAWTVNGVIFLQNFFSNAFNIKDKK